MLAAAEARIDDVVKQLEAEKAVSFEPVFLLLHLSLEVHVLGYAVLFYPSSE